MRWTKLDEFVEGASFQGISRTITETDLVLFSSLSNGHHQPLHSDLEWVRENTVYRERLVPGPQVLAYAIGAISASQVYSSAVLAFLGLNNVRSHAPLYPGETMKVSARVAQVRPSRSKDDRGIVGLAVEAYKGEDETLMTFDYDLMIRR